MPPSTAAVKLPGLPSASVKPPAGRGLLTAILMLASLMPTLDSTIANVALPYMQGSMSASQEEINWVLTSYIVASAIMTAPTGFLAARFGRTRLFVFAVFGFTVGSVLCGMAQTLDQIVIYRIIQGMCGAVLVPLSQSVLFDIYPLEQRGRAMAMWGMGVMVGPVIGPILGGLLTANYNWRWVFYINVPFGLLVAFGLLRFLPERPANNLIKLDWIGFGALSLGIGALQALLDRGETLGWLGSHEIVVELCLASLGFYIFLVQFLLAPKPFLSPKLFTDPNYICGMIFIFLAGLILYATMALLAPYLQELMDYPVATAGAVLAPRGAGTIVAALICGRLVGRVDPRLLLAGGLLSGAYALHQMMFWTPDVSEWTVISLGFLQGFSMGFFSVTLAVTTFASLPSELRTEAAGIYNLMRNLGSSIGISVTGALLQSNIQRNHAAIVEAVTPFRRPWQTGVSLNLWNTQTVAGATAMNAEITRQASIIAYADDFKVMLVLSFLALPLLLLMRPVSVKATVAGTADRLPNDAAPEVP